MVRKTLRRLRYGEPVVVVSGLPRSGTSLVMSMLAAGGLSLVTDGTRAADDDNPRGYFEFEPVKDLAGASDKSWVRAARGKGVKVISHLLRELPAEHYYQVLLVTRDLDEVMASQRIMLRNLGNEEDTDDSRVRELYRRHLAGLRALALTRPNFELLEVRYLECIASPREVAAGIARFLGRPLELEAMAGAVDERLYRNRRAQDAPA